MRWIFRLLLVFWIAASSASGHAYQSFTSTSYPWVYPTDMAKRISSSRIVVSGTVQQTSEQGSSQIDGVAVTVHRASLLVDRVFKGDLKIGAASFTWYSPRMSEPGGMVYSGPPLASYRTGIRYLVFLEEKSKGLVVTVPVYATEVRLGHSRKLSGVSPSLSEATEQVRNAEIAEEFQTAALLEPPPAAGVTGEAALYFPYVVELIGGCSEPFLRYFAGSSSKELRTAAQNWLASILNKRLPCRKALPPAD